MSKLRIRESYIKFGGILLILLSVFFLHVKLYHFSATTKQGELQVEVCLGRVINIDTSDEADQILTFQIISGQFRNETVRVDNIWIGRAFGDRIIHKGDVLFLDIPIRDPNNPRSSQSLCVNTSEHPFCYTLQAH